MTIKSNSPVRASSRISVAGFPSERSMRRRTVSSRAGSAKARRSARSFSRASGESQGAGMYDTSAAVMATGAT
jgi:hypothetical protein